MLYHDLRQLSKTASSDPNVGIQRIDIMILAIRQGHRVCIPIELKSTVAPAGITVQLQRYVDWIQQYYLPNLPSDIEPMLIARAIPNKASPAYQALVDEFIAFNNRNTTLRMRYVEFSIDAQQGTIDFQEIVY